MYFALFVFDSAVDAFSHNVLNKQQLILKGVLIKHDTVYSAVCMPPTQGERSV